MSHLLWGHIQFPAIIYCTLWAHLKYSRSLVSNNSVYYRKKKKKPFLIWKSLKSYCRSLDNSTEKIIMHCLSGIFQASCFNWKLKWMLLLLRSSCCKNHSLSHWTLFRVPVWTWAQHLTSSSLPVETQSAWDHISPGANFWSLEAMRSGLGVMFDIIGEARWICCWSKILMSCLILLGIT